MKSCDYLVWEKLVVFCVMGLIIIQGGFFEDSYLLIGGCIAFLMLSDREKFCGDIKFTFGLGVVSFLFFDYIFFICTAQRFVEKWSFLWSYRNGSYWDVGICWY